MTNVVGPTVAGLLVDHFGWRSTFWTIFAFHLAGLVIFFICCPKETKNRFYKDTPFDATGCVLFILFIAVATLVCTLGNTLGWSSPIIIAGLLIVVASLVGLLVTENRKGSAALLPLDLYKRNSNFTKLFFIAVCGCIVNMAPVNFLSLYLQKIGGTSATASGLPFSLIYLVTLFFTFTISRLKGLKPKKVLVFSSFVCMIVIGILAYWLAPTVGENLVIMNIIAACYGVGNAITTTTIYDAAAEYVDTADIGMATSLVYMGITFGGSVGLAILQLIMNSVTASTGDLGSGIKGLFWGSFTAAVIMTVLTLSLRDKKKTE